MNIAEYSIHKKTITLVLCVLIFLGGIYSYQNLGRLEDPEFTVKDAVVFTVYPGATPEEVAEEVTDVIETEIQRLPQLDQIESISKAGVSVITVTIKDKYDGTTLPQVWDELRRRVTDVQSQLPPGVMPSVVNDNFGDVYGILLAATGDGYSYEEMKEYVEFLRREMLLVDGVAKVELWGLQEEAVFVEISRSKISQLGISENTIYQILNQQNMVVPAGSVKVGPEYIRIHSTGDFASVNDIANLKIRDVASDKVITLSDIAEVKRGYVEPPEKILRFDGKKAISIGISVVPGGNVVTMGVAVRKRLEELKAETPLGIELGVINFQSDDVTAAVDGFLINFLEAVAIVVVVLLIFMGMRSGLLIGAVLALTVLGTFIVMSMMHINLERISLGALVIALGMLVDNAIVVTEGMLVRIEKGMDRIASAKEVVDQNIMPLLGATVIAVLAFAAIGASQDSTGEYCRSLFKVMLISLMMSWIIAITITPLFCTMFLKGGDVSSEDDAKDPYKGVIFTGYKFFLKFCLKRRWATVLVMVLLLGTAIYGFGLLKNSFFPPSTRSQFMLHYWLPEGTDIRKTSSDIEKIETYLLKDERIKSTASYIGAGISRFMLTITPENSMTKSYGLILISVDDYKVIDNLIVEIDQYLEENYLDAEPKMEKFMLGPGGGADVEARFIGPDNKILRKLSEQAQSIMRQDPNSVSIRDDWRQKVKLIRPVFDDVRAQQAGITRAMLNDTLQQVFTGKRVGLYREGDKILPIIVRPPDDERLNVEQIQNVQIWSPVSGRSIPVNQIVTGFETTWEDAMIRRLDKRRVITAECDAKFGILGSVVFENVRKDIEAIELPAGYTMEWGGEFENSQKAMNGLAGSLPITFLLMVLIVIMLFNALKQPLIIWLTVPLSIIGVSIGLLVFDLPFDFMAILGFLSLVGMLIKNAIVLLDQIDLEIKSGKEKFTAIVDSCISRMRPVTMAAITTVLGMLPLLLDPFFKSMAVTIMAGLSFATVLTLIVVPVLYAILFRIPYNASME